MNTHLQFCKIAFVILSILFVSNISFAQLTGTKTIDNTLPTAGNNYQSFTDAFTALNSVGVGLGGVTFNVTAGQTFSELPPELSATGTSSNPLVFQKSGVGVNPKIIPNISGTKTTTTLGNDADGIILLNGIDYVTFNGIDLDGDAANVTSATTKYEYGYYIKKASGSNACKNVTIVNCNITLYGTVTPFLTISSGIYISNISGTSTVTVTSIDGRHENINVNSNSISGGYLGIQMRGYNSLSPYDFYDHNINIGDGGGNTISSYGGTSTTAYGIYSIYVDSLKVNNNNISGGTGTTTTQWGIFFSTANNASIDVINNTLSMVNNSTTSQVVGIGFTTGTITGTDNIMNVKRNTVTNISRPASTSGVTYFIYATSNYPNIFNIDSNTIGSSTLPGTGAVYGIYQISNPVILNIRYNTVSNITRSSATSTSSMYGINTTNSAATTSTTVSHNTVSGIAGSGSSGVVGGINIGTQNINYCHNNRIFDISSLTTAGLAYGINNSGTMTNAYFYNNFISDIRTPAATGTNSTIGINLTSGTNLYVFNNTVYLNASSTSVTTFGSSAISVSTTPTIEIRNNILVNVSTPGPTGGLTVAYRRSSTTLTTYSNSSNYNNFHAGIPSSTRLIYTDGTNFDQTLADFKLRMSSRDQNSVAEMSPFVNVAVTPYDLHINTSIATQCESGGSEVTTPIAITTDYDGNPRYPNPGYPFNPMYPPIAPDIGADEFAGIPLDVTSPVISYTPLLNSSSITSRQLTATITDANGVATGSNSPRLYYKKSTDISYVFDNTPSVMGNDYTFTINYTNIGGVTSGDIIQYYVAAQDVNGNVATNPTGGSGINPPGTTPPGIPNQYSVVTGISGTFTVGTTGTYATLTAAVNDINNKEITGPVILNLIDLQYLSETYPITLNANSGSSSTNTLRIQQATGVAAEFDNTVGNGMLILNGFDYLIIDGSPTLDALGNKNLNNNTDGFPNLTLSQTSSTAPIITLQNDATNNRISNCIIRSDYTSTSSGLILIGSTTGPLGNDCNEFSYNQFMDEVSNPANMIYSNGNSLYPNSCNVIEFNEFSNFTNHGISVTAIGNGSDWEITSNDFNCSFVATTSQTAINFVPGTNSVNNVIAFNAVGGTVDSLGGTNWVNSGNITFNGIVMNVGTSDTSAIFNNFIAGISLTGTGTATFNAINLTGGNIQVYLNFISKSADSITNAGNSTTIGINSTVSSPGFVSLEGNFISEIYALGTGTGIGLRGISHIGSAGCIIMDNEVSDLTSSASTTSEITSSVIGIYTSSANTNQLISNNLIYNLQCIHPTAATVTQGIIVNTGTSQGVISNNRIYNLFNESNSLTSDVFGIHTYFGDSWTVINNQIALIDNYTTERARRVGLFDDNGTANLGFYHYNSIYIGGNYDIAANISSYGILRTVNTVVNMKNNIVFNNTTGGALAHFTLANTLNSASDGWSPGATDNNLLVNNNNDTLVRWGTLNLNLNDYRNISGCDISSMGTTPSTINPANLFTNVVSGDLGIITSNPEAWYIYGKGLSSTVPSVNSDFNGNFRPTQISDGASDIGSIELSSAPSATPPTIVQNIAASGTYTFNFAGKPVGQIIVNGFSDAPFDISWKHFSGVNPPNSSAQQYSNSFDSVWVSSGTFSGTDYEIRIFSYRNELRNIGDTNNIVLAKSNNGGIEWIPSPGSTDGYTPGAPGYAYATGLTTFSLFAITSSDGPLPVELASFTASANRNNVDLKWTTITEINNSGFDIERKNVDSEFWTKVSEIQGAGNSTQTKNYTYTDRNLNTGKYNYRLKQKDFNGNFTYYNLSSEIIVGVPNNFELSQNYPNPFNPSTKINYDLPVDSKISLKIFDMLGREVYSMFNSELIQAGYHTAQLNLGNLSSGTYFYRIIAKGVNGKEFIMTKKMQLIK